MISSDRELKEVSAYIEHLQHPHFPCIGAKTALAKDNISCLVAPRMDSDGDDASILQFLYEFIIEYRRAEELYYSAAVIFSGPEFEDEETFDKYLWQRLQGLSNLDAANYKYDTRVSADPASPDFSFSLKEEALYVIGLHPLSSRLARRFRYPAMVFNPHAQFEQLRGSAKYEMMKKVVRKRDIQYSGSTNPMLEDFGKQSEVSQYSGRKYDADWQCPLIIKHGETEHHSTS